MSDILESKDGFVIPVRLCPRASKDAVGDWHDGRVKIFITSPPVDNKANRHLIKILSKLLKVPQSQISILSGHKSRNKSILVQGASREEIFGIFK